MYWEVLLKLIFLGAISQKPPQPAGAGRSRPLVGADDRLVALLGARRVPAPAPEDAEGLVRVREARVGAGGSSFPGHKINHIATF